MNSAEDNPVVIRLIVAVVRLTETTDGHFLANKIGNNSSYSLSSSSCIVAIVAAITTLAILQWERRGCDGKRTNQGL